MKQFLYLLLFIFPLTACTQQYRDGDIIFQSSPSRQSAAIEEATQSPYSHCGIIFYENNVAYVYEAVQPVGKRRLDEWIESGVNAEFVVKRLDTVQLTENKIKALKSYAIEQFGKNYDGKFNWSDKEMYCSELVYKCYWNACQIKLATPRPLREFNIDGPIVRKIMKERYGNDIPYDEPMISPDQLVNSRLLITVN
ncbi:MAG: YiiX family permuted papain-like enzyme [Crocinitomicaceae bacterium]|jgi:hypothetical protein|nr:YiiX family permuted papain-like enzyme [Crocinitomicaceae bacterium]MDP4760146.1 YiiX family permuted papain-like enzyme [Crocinitomicaceae bacterium]